MVQDRPVVTVERYRVHTGPDFTSGLLRKTGNMNMGVIPYNALQQGTGEPSEDDSRNRELSSFMRNELGITCFFSLSKYKT